MRCERARRWTSDALDGRLSGRRGERLRRHLETCAACRAYRADLAVIQARTRDRSAPVLAPEDWNRFERNLERELETGPPAVRRRALPLGLRLRWIWAGAAVAAVAGAAVFYLAGRGSASLDPVFLSYEGSLSQIYRELRDDPALADAFNHSILTSIGESLQTDEADLPVDLLSNPDFLVGWAGDTWNSPAEEHGPEAR